MSTVLLPLVSSATLLAGSAGVTTAADPGVERLLAGNRRFVAGALQQKTYAEQRHSTTAAQHPFAVIVGCSDSRVPPEILFDQGIGDLFVIRTAGNVIDDPGLASIEYAVEHLGAKLVVVLGHESCGAVQACIRGGTTAGHLIALLHAISPAVEVAKGSGGDLTSAAVDANVVRVVHQLRASEPLMKEWVAKDEVKVVGMRYNLSSGEAIVLPER